MSYERDVQAFNDRAASYEAGRLGQLHRDFADRAIRIALAVAPAPSRVLDVGSGTGYALRQLAVALPGAIELTGVDAAPDMVRVASEANEAGGAARGGGAAEGGGAGEADGAGEGDGSFGAGEGDGSFGAGEGDGSFGAGEGDGSFGADGGDGSFGAGGGDGSFRGGGDGRVRFVEGTAEQLPLPDASVDLVISTTSFDHWADQRAGLAECARVLVPGGHLVLSDLFSVLLWPTLLGPRRGKARTRRRATALITEVGLRSPQWTRLAGPIVQTVTAAK